jgi:hypothetical protein
MYSFECQRAFRWNMPPFSQSKMWEANNDQKACTWPFKGTRHPEFSSPLLPHILPHFTPRRTTCSSSCSPGPLVPPISHSCHWSLPSFHLSTLQVWPSLGPRSFTTILAPNGYLWAHNRPRLFIFSTHPLLGLLHASYSFLCHLFDSEDGSSRFLRN